MTARLLAPEETRWVCYWSDQHWRAQTAEHVGMDHLEWNPIVGVWECKEHRYPHSGQGATTVRVEDLEPATLGPCGCVDYHVADCPTRTGYQDAYDDDEGWY